MHKGWIIFKNELYAVFARPSFWMAVFFLPVISLALYGGAAWFSRSQSAGETQFADKLEELVVPKGDNRPQAFVDQADVVRLMPPGFHKDRLLAYPDEASARKALVDGKIKGYFAIPSDYLKTGLIYYNFEETNFASTQMSLTSTQSGNLFRTLLNYNLLEGDSAALEWIEAPVTKIRANNLSTDSGKLLLDFDGGVNQKAMLLPYTMESFMAMGIMAAAGLLLTAFNKEHENRTLEILMTSTRAYPLLIAKTGALGLAGLVQFAAWGTSMMFLAQMSGQFFSMPDLLSFSPAVLAWALVLLVAGYLFYGALMVSAAALFSGLREFSQVAGVLSLPLGLPLVMIYAFLKEPNGLAAMLLSFIPFTASPTIVARMMIVRVPVWQPALALALLVISALVAMRITASLFHAQRLLGGSKFYMSDWFQWLKKKRNAILVK